MLYTEAYEAYIGTTYECKKASKMQFIAAVHAFYVLNRMVETLSLPKMKKKKIEKFQ